MSFFIFTTSLRVRLGLPHPGLLRQPSYVCGHPLDPVGTHILQCSHGSERTATHDDLRDVLAAIAWDGTCGRGGGVCHSPSHAARLKEEAYAIHHLMRPGSRRRRMPFAITGIYFTPLRLRFLGRFTWP
ncbi:unnamed protein product [Calypogeia fissa]